jgi:hypothetical protein
MSRITPRPIAMLVALLAGLSFCPSFAGAGSAGVAASGTKLWTRRYNGLASGADEAWSLTRSQDGTKVFVTGQSYAGRRYSSPARATADPRESPELQDFSSRFKALQSTEADS